MQSPGIDERQRLAARHQSMRRDVNEWIERLGARRRYEFTEYDFACECAIESCSLTLTMTPDAYEAVRRFPTRFAVHGDHVLDEVERVVERSRLYSVVEKFGVGGIVALELDPRRK